MANVLKLDCVSNNGDVEADFGSAPYSGPYPEVWVEVDVAFNATFLTALAALAPGSEEELVKLYASDGSTFWEEILLSRTFDWDTLGRDGGFFGGAPSGGPYTPPSLVAMQFYRLKFHLHAGTPATAQAWIDGVSVGPITMTGINMTSIQFVDLEAIGLAQAGAFVYYDNFQAGTTDGGTDIFTDDFEGTLSKWNSFVSGDASIIADPGIAPAAAPVTPAEGMVGIAFDDDTLAPSPVWTWIDLNPNLVATWTIDRGRIYELDQNDTGRATVTINDRDGILDPLNTGGTYYGKIEPLKQITLRRWNPVTLAWSTRYRGFIEDYDYTEHPSQHFMQLVISCVDGTEILSSIEMQPDAALFGTTPLDPGTVFYDNAQVNDRIIELYTDAGWPALLAVVFTGNVFVQETTYSAGETIWSAILEAADAEFPGVANVYFSRLGELTFHGRYARFDPVAVAASSGGSWVFTHWKCGDSAAVQASISDTAQIRGISFNRGLAKIINQARATPMFIPRADVTGQVYADAPSAAIYGVRSWSADDLILQGGKVTNIGDNKAESLLYAQYYVDNFKDPKNRISQLVFKSLPPSDTRAAPLWDLLCGVEISDMIDVHVRHPVGGTITGGFTGESFFVEGIHEVEEPSGSTSYNLTTVTLDVSPQGYYSGFPSAPIGGARATHAATGKPGTVFHT